jgi:hypothetical protein
MKQNVMNQTVILGLNKDERLFTESFWKHWRLKIYELVIKLATETKQAWQRLRSLWLLKTLGKVLREIFYMLFVPPPQQERIEEARMKAMQYRGII